MRKIVLEIGGVDFLDHAVHEYGTYPSALPVYTSRKVVIVPISLNERRAAIGHGSTSEGGDGSQWWPLLTICKGRKVGRVLFNNLPGWDIAALMHDRGFLRVVLTRGL